MAKTKDNYYFDQFIHLVDYSCRAAEFLNNVALDYKQHDMEALKDEIHLIEHEADLEKHKVVEILVKEFLPPLDREDILSLLRDIDDVTDAVEDVVLTMYFYNVTKTPPVLKQFTRVIYDCTIALKELMVEFVHFKRSKKIGELIYNVLKFEQICDGLYASSLRELYTVETDTREILIWTDLYNRLEKCCDLCGKVSSTVETAYMKNI
jgi:predicted phosphate transport protein (TIGR00153 family)